MKLIKQLAVLTGLISAVLIANAAFAQADVSQECPLFLSALNACQPGLRGMVLLIVNFFLGFLGLVAVVMVIYGGFLYVTSAGNEENVNKAKKILLYAAIGIIVIIISFALVRTILGAAGTEPA